MTVPARGSWLHRARQRRNALRRMACINNAVRVDRLALLAQLSGKLACEHGLSTDELLDAEAALRLPPRARQPMLPLRGVKP